MTDIVYNKNGIPFDIDAIATDLNGKADTDLTNCTNTANIKMAHNAMPSNAYIDLTVGESGSTYTAPADGYISAFCVNSTMCNLHCGFINSTDFQMGGSSDRYACIPIAKGAVFSFYYNGTVNYLKFIYAVGSESEAQ